MDGKPAWITTWHRSNELCFMVAWSIFKAMAPLGGRPNTQLGDHVTPNAHSRWFVLFYHVWGPAWIKIHWNSIWLRVRSHMTSRCYTWGFGTTLHDFGGVFGRPLDTLFWTLTISWSWLLAHMWSGPKLSFVTHQTPRSASNIVAYWELLPTSHHMC